MLPLQRLRAQAGFVSHAFSRSVSTTTTTSPTPWTVNRYPPARRSDHVDVYRSEAKGEVRVSDPYQWLEENTDETDQWTTTQERFTRAYLDQHANRQKLEDEIRSNTNYAKFSAPSLKDDGRWYWYYNTGLQAQTVLYRSEDEILPDFSKQEGPGGDIFFDPNLLSEDGTVSLAHCSFSHCGAYFAYAISISGSDFVTIYIRSTKSPLAEVDGKRPEHHDDRLPEEIGFVKFSSIAWTKDSKGFFYQRYPERQSVGQTGIETGGDQYAMLFYHRIGTSQSEDVLIIKDDERPERRWSVHVSEDGTYIALYITEDTSRKNLMWITDLEKNEIGPNMSWHKVVDELDAEYEIISNDGAKFYIRTNKNAPLYKVIVITMEDEKWDCKDLIPEDQNGNLEEVKAVDQNKFAVKYKRNVKDEIHIYSSDGLHLAHLAADFVGAAAVSCRRKQSWLFVTMTGFNTPGTVAHYDFEKDADRWSIYRTTSVSGLNPDDFEVQQVWYESKDGTKVPMFIVRHKSTQFDGTAPAIQYGYGGFSISIDPFFSPSILTFLQKYKAVLAVPNIRGGGEFGENWHLAGTRERKVNVFNDFIAATQYLVKHKYAGAGKVAINGASNGGLLVAACVNMAPEGTFGAAVGEVGVMDLLKFANYTIGKAWTSDYGDPHNPHDFDFIYPISPLHNIPQDKILPPFILLTADHDDRVVPLHSFKLAATLQHTLAHNPHPLLIRIDKKAGHGGGKSTEQRIKEAADKWGFVAQTMGLTWHEQ